MLHGSVGAPRLLNRNTALKVEALELLLEMEHGLGMTNEHLGAAALVLRVVQSQIANDRQTAVFRRTLQE
jgi:hypothetical protein